MNKVKRCGSDSKSKDADKNVGIELGLLNLLYYP